MNKITKKVMLAKETEMPEKMKLAKKRVAEILERTKQPASKKKFTRVSTKGTWTKMSTANQSATYPADSNK